MRLTDELNYFYTRFEASNTEACMGASAVPDDCLITLSIADVSKTFKQVNIHRAVGPDGLPGCVLRARADQLVSIFTDIFNLSLTKSVIPICFKQTTIVPVPKNTKVTCLNDYRPVALTTLDPLQFAYRPSRSIDDAISIALHTALSHLDKKNTYVRMLWTVPKRAKVTELNDYCPVAVTSVIMKCFERLVKDHLHPTGYPRTTPIDPQTM